MAIKSDIRSEKGWEIASFGTCLSLNMRLHMRLNDYQTEESLSARRTRNALKAYVKPTDSRGDSWSNFMIRTVMF